MAFQEGNCSNAQDLFSLMDTFLQTSANHTLIYSNGWVSSTANNAFGIERVWRWNNVQFKITADSTSYSGSYDNQGVGVYPNLNGGWQEGDPQWGDGHGSISSTHYSCSYNNCMGYGFARFLPNEDGYTPTKYKFFSTANSFHCSYLMNTSGWAHFGWCILDKAPTSFDGSGFFYYSSLSAAGFQHAVVNTTQDSPFHSGHGNDYFGRGAKHFLYMTDTEAGESVDKAVLGCWSGSSDWGDSHVIAAGGTDVFSQYRRCTMGNPYSYQCVADSSSTSRNVTGTANKPNLYNGRALNLFSSHGQVPIALPMTVFVSGYLNSGAYHIFGDNPDVKYVDFRYCGYNQVVTFPDDDYYIVPLNRAQGDTSISGTESGYLGLAVRYNP